MAITQAEYRWLSLGRHPRALRAGVRVAGRAARARLRGHRVLSLGQALAAGLRAGLSASGVPVWLDTPMTGLEVQDGRVSEVRASRGGEQALIRARRGVLVATGGFERNEEMRRRYQRAPVGTQWTTGAAGNAGDGIRAGLDLGAATGLMDDAWWGPSIPLPGGPYFCLAERSLPGCLLVNGAGDLGTKGGLRTDERARVLRADGSPIEGLYAAGNASASVMSHSYASAGATIGRAMTFGYIAARAMAS